MIKKYFVLSDEANKQLVAKGYTEEILNELMYSEEEYFYLRDIIEYPNSLEFEIQAGGMSLVTLHIAVSSSL